MTAPRTEREADRMTFSSSRTFVNKVLHRLRQRFAERFIVVDD
jgi:hypothetical protein